MGMRGPFSRTCCLTPPNSEIRLPNPNPARFTILRTKQVGSAVVAEVRYPDCTNYEGRKVLVFDNTNEDALRKRTTLDPHFAESGGPVARLEPTERGWSLATEIALNVSVDIEPLENYEELREKCTLGDVIVCLVSDTAAWQRGARYDIIRFDVDCVVVSRQNYNPPTWLWPWGRNQNLEFGKVINQEEK